MTLHPCPHPTCTHQIEGKHFACSVHWMALPQSLRDEINQAGRRGDRQTRMIKQREAMLWFHRDAAAKNSAVKEGSGP
jgi:hypothetical protein